MDEIRIRLVPLPLEVPVGSLLLSFRKQEGDLGKVLVARIARRHSLLTGCALAFRSSQESDLSTSSS